MKKLLIPFFAVILLSACSQDTEHSMDAHDNDHDHAAHSHDTPIPMDFAESIPSIDLLVFEDPKSGWNLQLNTENFRFAPMRASTDHIEGEGHAHLYIDGEKIGRIYGEWYHYDGDLDSGEHEFRVNLTANPHNPLTYQGEEIDDTEMVVVE